MGALTAKSSVPGTYWLCIRSIPHYYRGSDFPKRSSFNRAVIGPSKNRYYSRTVFWRSYDSLVKGPFDLTVIGLSLDKWIVHGLHITSFDSEFQRLSKFTGVIPLDCHKTNELSMDQKQRHLTVNFRDCPRHCGRQLCGLSFHCLIKRPSLLITSIDKTVNSQSGVIWQSHVLFTVIWQSLENRWSSYE